MSAAVHSEPPARGTLMQDNDGRRGQFRGIANGRFFLRPIGGGREWSVNPDDCEVAVPTDVEESKMRLSAELHRQNLHSLARRG